MSALASCGAAASPAACPALLGLEAKWAAVSLVTASSLGVAFSDVLVDAIVVTRSRGRFVRCYMCPHASSCYGDQSAAGSLQSLCWSASSLGSILSGMLTYADGCRRMQTDADVCSRMLTCADVC